MENKKKKKKQNKNILIKKNNILLVVNVVQSIILSVLLGAILVLYESKMVIERDRDKQTPDKNYVLLGDSITDWYPIYNYFSEQAPIINSGIAGYKTTDVLENMNGLVYRYNPSDVFIEIGINDLNAEEPDKEKIYDNIIKIVENIKKNRPFTKIYVESVYPINRGNNERIDLPTVGKRENINTIELNKKLKNYCDKNDVEYIDIYSKLSDGGGNLKLEYTRDGVHLSEEGYSVVSDILKKYIKEW